MAEDDGCPKAAGKDNGGSMAAGDDDDRTRAAGNDSGHACVSAVTAIYSTRKKKVNLSAHVVKEDHAWLAC